MSQTTRYAAGVLTSRSSLECHLFMELHPCECGETRGPQRHKLVSGDQGLVAAYEDACPRCGRMRRFDFLLDPELVPADWFGGANVSSIVDAGQYLAVADDAAKQVPGNVAALGGEDRRRAAWFMTRAVHALDEVLKFIPPGAEQVPDAAFFTEQGRAIRAREPGRFRKLRLEAVLGAYEELLRGLGVTLKPRPVRAPVATTPSAEPARRRTPTMEILVPAQQPTSGRKRTPTMELLVPASPQMPTSSQPMPSSHAMSSLSTASGAGMPSMPSMPSMPPPPSVWPAPPQSVPVVVTADEARALGLPAIGFRVDLAGTSMSAGKFPEAGKYLTASGPPGGPLLAIVWATAQRESHLGAVEAALREHFSQPWQQPLVIGTGGNVHIGGAARPGLAFMTGESLSKIAWCGVVMSTPNASVLVTLGRGPGYAAAMSCEEVLAHPSLAAFARSFTLLP